MLRVLAINVGSSSLKYALFDGGTPVLRAEIERLGDEADPHAAAVDAALAELARRGERRPDVVGHRVVHGGPDRDAPARIDAALLDELRALIPFAPDHLPAELAAIAAIAARWPDIPQVACFDTAFHRTMPDSAQRYAVPDELFALGVRRYGFHGLSYDHAVHTLGAGTLGRAVIAHLGHGASMVAVRDGRAIDTTMGMSPAGGMIMGTRTGDLDPGVMLFLLAHHHDPASLAQLVHHDGGLRALSGGSSDMRDLLARRATDARAARAVAAFCMSARKWIGARAATLGGLDTLVFTGGIGARSPVIRAEIAAGREHLDVWLDEARNWRNAALISSDSSKCDVRVIEADEEAAIARLVTSALR